MAQEQKLGFVYPDLFSGNNGASGSHHHHTMQSYAPEMMQAAAGMEMLGFFPSKDVGANTPRNPSAAQTLWRDAGHISAAAAAAGVSSSSHYYDYGPGLGYSSHQQQEDDQDLLSPTAPPAIGWHQQGGATTVTTAGLYPGIGPGGGGGEHYSAGARSLSLSLCNSSTVVAPSPSGTAHQQHVYQHQQQQQPPPQMMLRGSKYLASAQDILSEFCSLDDGDGGERKGKAGGKKRGKHAEDGASSSSSTPPTPSPSLMALDVMELQRRKARLLSMLEEVDRRYKRYCHQMQAVVANFEATTREGAATAYTAMASRAMSRHFRCLRDGVMGQIKAIRKVVEDKSCGQPTTPGTTKGETPRLKVLDQYIRQQKAFQQGAGMMEHQPWRPQRGLPERSVSILRAWLFEHFLHPYPSDVDKHILARQTGLSRSQVSNWFINARVRLWKPMVEEMYLEETKEENDTQTSTNGLEDSNFNSANNNFDMISNLHNPKPEVHPLSSIYRRDPAPDPTGRALMGPVDLDFFSYNSSNHHHYQQEQHHSQGQPFGPTGVSLTLGLVQQQQQQQYERGGVSLAFPPGGTCQQVETRALSVMDGDVQGLPYRNLMGASQLLHDLAG